MSEKSKSGDANAQANVPKGAPNIADLTARIPAMDDTALNTLHANAVRLQTAGNTQQRNSAAALLPVLEAERAKRSADKAAAAPVKKPRAPAAPKARKAKPKSDIDSESED